MPYFSLTAGQGYLRGQDVVDPQLKSEAEAWADTRIDETFWNWNRDTWTGMGVPKQIAQAAEMLCAGKYLEKAYAVGNPNQVGDSLSRTLIRDGEKALMRIIDQGGPIDPTNPNYILPPFKSRAAGRVVRIVPG